MQVWAHFQLSKTSWWLAYFSLWFCQPTKDALSPATARGWAKAGQEKKRHVFDFSGQTVLCCQAALHLGTFTEGVEVDIVLSVNQQWQNLDVNTTSGAGNPELATAWTALVAGSPVFSQETNCPSKAAVC